MPRTSQPEIAQLTLPLHGVAAGPTGDVVLVHGTPVPLRFVRHPRARRYVLRVASDGTAVVTMPRRGSKRDAWRFVEAHLAWIARERAALAEAAAQTPRLGIGETVLVDGQALTIEAANEPDTLRVGERRVALHETRDVDTSVWRWLRRRARAELPARLQELAAAHGLAVAGVSIRNQRTRWGSCSSDGRISLNWRLVQMPVEVRDYVLLHELIHLRVRNHSPRFWREVERVCPGYGAARHWLRTEGRALL